MFEVFVKTAEDGEIILTTPGNIALWVLFAALVLVATYFTSKGQKSNFQTKQIVFCGVGLALAIVTSYIEVYSFPFGGSVTLMSMLFICFIGYLYGPKTSIPVAIAYGILQLILKPYIYHPVQVIFDYPLAFGALGLSGFFYKSKYGLLKGYIIGIVGRWIFASVSGYVFFAEYAWDGWNPIAYTLAYNGAYIFTEAAVTILLLLLPVVNIAFGQVKKMAVEN
jgi:thiamine transporter